MNTLKDISELSGFAYQSAGCCCPEKGYVKQPVFAIVRVSNSIRYIFTDGRTLTIGRKTRYATFPRSSHLLDIASEAINELREKHPLTKNCYVTENVQS